MRWEESGVLSQAVEKAALAGSIYIELPTGQTREWPLDWAPQVIHSLVTVVRELLMGLWGKKPEGVGGCGDRESEQLF